MPLHALTRAPGPELAQCELTHLERQPIDFALALAQHRAYVEALINLGIRVTELPADPAHPDGVFVEDIAVVLDEVAVITSPMPRSRRGERASVAEALKPFRPLRHIPDKAYLEGGDVLQMGRTLYVGLTSRTNAAGVEALAELVQPFGYNVVAVRVYGCLHLKTACTSLDAETLLINRAWADTTGLSKFRMVDVPAKEPWGANVLSLPGGILGSTAYPRTCDLIRSLGYVVTALDLTELHKAEAGLTCTSLVFDVGHVSNVS